MLDFLAAQILSIHDIEVEERLEKRREEMKNKVYESNGELQ